MNVSFLNKKLLKSTFAFILIEGSVLGIIAVFINEIIISYKWCFIAMFILLFVLYHIFIWVYANSLKRITLKIKTSTFEIKFGDIFEQKNLKVINFNEYFDTQVDNKVIADNSLNGGFIRKIIKNPKKLDELIEKSLANQKYELNDLRKFGKKKKYELGTIVEYNNYLLTALTKFDEDNRANLTLKEYLVFLMNFWDSLDKIYANRSVSITLFGSSSITRFNDTNDVTDQDLVEIILWTFRVSKIKFKYPTTISLVLSKDLINKINLYEVKEKYKDGV